MGEVTPAKAVQDEKPRVLSFGERLRREREKREISLDDVSVSTKISLRMLRALEQEKFDQLPGGIFNKGFVRAYARHLGIDEDQAIADYLEAVGEIPPPAPLETVIETPPLAPKPQGETGDFEVPWGTLAIVLLLAALGLSLWSYRTREMNTGLAQPPAASPAQPPSQPPVAQSPTSDAAIPNSASPGSVAPNPVNSGSPAPNLVTPGAPVPSSPAPNPVTPAAPKSGSPAPNPVTPAAPAPTSPGSNSLAATPAISSQPRPAPPAATTLDSKSQIVPPPAAGNSVKNSGLVSPDSKPAVNPPAPAARPAATFGLLIEAQENSWVSITADGKTILEGTLIAPAVKSIRAEKMIVVRAGNVGGLDFSLNSKKLPPQGESGEAKTLVFSPAGLEDPVSKPPTQ